MKYYLLYQDGKFLRTVKNSISLPVSCSVHNTEAVEPLELCLKENSTCTHSASITVKPYKHQQTESMCAEQQQSRKELYNFLHRLEFHFHCEIVGFKHKGTLTEQKC